MWKDKLRTRSGLTLLTWAVSGILILILLFGVGSQGDGAFLWASIGSTFIRK